MGQTTDDSGDATAPDMVKPECERPSLVTPGEVTKNFNVQNAKIVAFILVLGFVFYHGVIHIKYGSDSCKWLLSDGRFQGRDEWQPYGCMMHKYTSMDSRNCMHYISYWGGKNSIAFVGDSRIRQLYFEFISMLGNNLPEPTKAHTDLFYADPKLNIRVEFLWHPMVNESMWKVYKSWADGDPKNRPTLVVTGSATWSIKQNNASMEALDNFKVNLTYTVPYFNKLKNTTKVLWILQDPVIESKLSPNKSMITNRHVDEYNRAAIEHLMYSAVTIWSSSRLVAQGYKRDSTDGLHIGKATLAWDIQILLNVYCNDHMNFNDGTCCSSAEPISTVQIITASVFAFSLLISIIMWLVRRRNRRAAKINGTKSRVKTTQREAQSRTSEGGEKWESVYTLVTSVAKLGIIMGYVFLCDRTNFFMKENKYYTHVNFFLPFSYIMILGFFFTENSDQTTLLHRDQTDEWKGWMQLAILIYHLTGASRVLQIYMQIRFLVSSYLFLSGFGHFIFFWKKGDYSLYRFCQVMFRMNFLVILLCFVMNRPYQFYYFVPLVSFWFLVIYVTTIWPRTTATSAEANGFHYLYVILKFAVLTVAITLLYASEVFFEKIFLTRPLKALFVTSDDSIHEWRFRWQLDRYSTVYGMVFAFGCLMARKFKLFDENKDNSLFSKAISWLVGVMAVCGFASYGVFAFFCKNKQACNDVHTYVVFLPAVTMATPYNLVQQYRRQIDWFPDIFSFIFLRNIPGWLRTRYSSFFAWFGKISLELFISQYHIWLAADTHGILVLVPSYPLLNVIITSFIFVCTAHEIHKVTNTLVPYLVPNDWKLLLRNIICFSSLLLPIAITHGVLGF